MLPDGVPHVFVPSAVKALIYCPAEHAPGAVARYVAVEARKEYVPVADEGITAVTNAELGTAEKLATFKVGLPNIAA
jgi:hypothetical protein